VKNLVKVGSTLPADPAAPHAPIGLYAFRGARYWGIRVLGYWTFAEPI
jgi:hypothetical protein